MTLRSRQIVLRANALFLLIAASWGLCTDLAGAFLGAGPVAKIVAAAPHAAIGLVEAHGLAIIVGCLLWKAPSARIWHLTGATVHVLLGTANLVFWPMFVAADMLPVGYVTTMLHGLFAALQLSALRAASAEHASVAQAEINPLSRTNQTGLTA